MKTIFLLACILGLAVGAEWQLIAPNVMTIALGVAASSHEEILVSGGTNNRGAAILKSTDAGETWNKVPIDRQAMYLAIDSALGTDLAVAGSLGFYGQVAVGSFSLDGENFQALPYNPILSSSQSVTAVAPGQFYLVGVWVSIRDGYTYGVISSQDSGATLNFHPWTGLTNARYGDFPSNNTWFISGGSWGDSRKSLDPEEPFEFNHRIKINPSPDKMSFEVMDISKRDRNGYIAVMQKSTDGGKTFETVYNDTGRFYFNGIDCIDELNCWVAAEGPEGAWILKSSDGGRTWVEQLFRPDDSLMDVQMLNENEGWAVGGIILSNNFNALFLHTVDGGKTWVVGNTVENAYPNAISLVSETSAYATAFMKSGLSSILAYR